MTWFEWLEIVYAYCTTAQPVENWRPIAVSTNILVAVAYFWIPTDMAIVFRRWRTEIPFPWLWTGFALFIIACGLSHVAHAFHALRQATPYTAIELAIMAVTAGVSLATALGFTIILPKIMTLTAPSEVKKRLEAEIDKATGDLARALETERLLLQEVHHRVKNNLQVTSSLVGLHLRQLPAEYREPLESLRARIGAMANIHNQLREAGVRSLSAEHFIDELCQKLKVANAREDIIHEIFGGDLNLSFEQATPFSLVMNEVLAIIFRHHFAQGNGSRIVITFDSSSDAQTISIVDDGRAWDQNEGHSDISNKLINSLSAQLNADISWSHPIDGGNAFELILNFPSH
ncbi:sensor histidine kinase [Hoeflea alexandrii]|uniref:sensor histidine kinase n=1 Tax=Hoeflea alexandrii TaxID=288436 RepID=UPI0035D07353